MIRSIDPETGRTPPSWQDLLGPRPSKGEVVPGLMMWLKKFDLDEYFDQANEWAGEQGAAVLSEVVECLDDLVESLQLNSEHAACLRRRGKVAFSALVQHGEMVRQPRISMAPDFQTRDPR